VSHYEDGEGNHAGRRHPPLKCFLQVSSFVPYGDPSSAP
jgi:hypothetical protein